MLSHLNRKLIFENRKVYLFLDNTICHPMSFEDNFLRINLFSLNIKVKYQKIFGYQRWSFYNRDYERRQYLDGYQMSTTRVEGDLTQDNKMMPREMRFLPSWWLRDGRKEDSEFSAIVQEICPGLWPRQPPCKSINYRILFHHENILMEGTKHGWKALI